MIIDGFRQYQGLKLSETYGELVYKGVEMGAHCERGWIHKGLIELAKDYKISGQSFRLSDTSDIIRELDKNRPCITSVTVCFNGGRMNSNGAIVQKGGHLIIVSGAIRENGVLQGFIVNHPSSYSHNNWENYIVSIEDFKRSFSNAFMSFWIDK